VEANVVGGVEMAVESGRLDPTGGRLEVRMLGPLTIRRHGTTLALPASRKVRALLAYLALARRPVSRTHLCELLWDVPNDPRGELRWCLSKVRGFLDEPACRRVQTCGDTIALDLTDCSVDALEVDRASQAGLDSLDPQAVRALAALFAGDFLEDLEIDRSPAFSGWLTAQRRRFRGCHAALLEHLVKSAPDDEVLGYLEQWLELAPFDQRVQELLLNVLARRGQIRIDLSPNFALGHYTLAFVHSQAGDPHAAISSSDHSRRLSPFDPLLFGMLGARAMALVRLGRFEEAADWGVKAAARPNAHAHILAIAAFSLALAGRLDEARAYLASIHKSLPRYRVDDFLTAMQFAPEGERLFREGAKRIGMK
jgi:DNA-binding SARP family transcriptional activator